MARTVASSGRSRRSMPRISAPMCLESGTTSSLVFVVASMAFSAFLIGTDVSALLRRDPLAPACRLVDEVDTERMVERRVEGMVIVDVGGIDPHPAVRSLGAAVELGLLDDIRAHVGLPRLR